MSHLDLTFSSRRQWCAAALFALAGGGFLTQAEAADAVVPDVKIVFSELLLWADRVAGMEMQFDHPREAQAEAFKGLGRDAAVVLKVAGNKEGHLLELDEKSRTLTLRTVLLRMKTAGSTCICPFIPLPTVSRSGCIPPLPAGKCPPILWLWWR
ncbi:hypothetical protein [Verrucomicrobium spinosum]|uniref:hypothetical protein n=1 Tax=Verrucomicrobium spinosum TaxID=2736 RepID=UPI0009467CA9|nr:hypothetical protein [Verrucomicrobium spinosum]